MFEHQTDYPEADFPPVEIQAEAEGAGDLQRAVEDAPVSDSSDADALETVEPLPLSAELSAVLFVAPKPLTTTQLAETLRATEEQVEGALAELRQRFSDEEVGFALREVAGAWQFRTAARAARTIQRLIPPRAKRLSRAAAESLAIIAYRQPVPRSEIEAIRGVDALPTLRTLLDARLIRIVGRSQSPGHPVLYGTTTTFLEKFGLRDLSDLPNSRELLELAGEQGESVLDEGSDAILSEEFHSAESANDSAADEAASDSSGGHDLSNTAQSSADGVDAANTPLQVIATDLDDASGGTLARDAHVDAEAQNPEL